MKVKIKSGRKGRPLTLDTSELEQKLFADMEKATKRLEQFREQSKGLKDERILGTSTTAPDFAYEALALLRNAKSLNYSQAKQLRDDLRVIQQLGSKQKRVYERALAKQMQTQYFEQLEKVTQSMNKQTQARAKAIKGRIESLTPQEQQNFFLSRSYQKPQSLGKYKKITEWSRADSGNNLMSEDEAGIYLIQKRLERGLGIGDLDEVYDYDESENPFI